MTSRCLGASVKIKQIVTLFTDTAPASSSLSVSSGVRELEVYAG